MQSSLDGFVRKSPGSGVKRRRADAPTTVEASSPVSAEGAAAAIPSTPAATAAAATATPSTPAATAAETPLPVDAATLARIEANRAAAMVKLAAKRARLAGGPKMPILGLDCVLR
ncbi:hypothetical protein I4F81_003239 [Pyropia yezoensis]|uniref:Uncharacterized protein n=1 Tax=Pyropia yezoensis TaxID=2788 RepID=A0ACC3BSG7_PYRYE|nr:hypothetical protein I4F81_003239 [Neopyropia yezoensis]